MCSQNIYQDSFESWTPIPFKNVFQYSDGDVYWCTADIGWVTGHSYIVYGPLLTGATTIMFEGVPTWPDAGRFWEVVDKYQVNQFYTAPTAIRALVAQGDEWVTKHDLSSLKVLGTVGEPINEEAWRWYHDLVGKGRSCMSPCTNSQSPPAFSRWVWFCSSIAQCRSSPKSLVSWWLSSNGNLPVPVPRSRMVFPLKEVTRSRAGKRLPSTSSAVVNWWYSRALCE